MKITHKVEHNVPNAKPKEEHNFDKQYEGERDVANISLMRSLEPLRGEHSIRGKKQKRNNTVTE